MIKQAAYLGALALGLMGCVDRVDTVTRGTASVSPETTVSMSTSQVDALNAPGVAAQPLAPVTTVSALNAGGDLPATAASFEPTAAPAPVEVVAPPDDAEYLGIGTRLLDGDLVAFDVKMKGARSNTDVAAYAECAAAQYALIRGYGFARHVRTAVNKSGSTWKGDATYVISDALPDGVAKIDAEVVTSACKENGIPTI